MKLRLALASSAVLLVAIACGGSSDTELFGAPSGSAIGTSSGGTSTSSGAASSTSSSGGSSGGSSTSSGSTSSSGGSSTSSSGGSSTSSSGGSSSGGSSSGGSSSGGSSSGGSSSGGSSSGGTTTGTIFCGGAECSSGPQVCCANFSQAPAAYQCVNAALLACAGQTKVACDDTTDCGSNQVCCALVDQNTSLGSAECKPVANCKSLGNLRAGVLCDPNAASDQCAFLGRTCQPSSALPGYFICKN